MNLPTVRSRVAEELSARILRGDLPLGPDINEVKLARDLEVSRTPVREAIVRLADDGLAELIPQ